MLLYKILNDCNMATACCYGNTAQHHHITQQYDDLGANVPKVSVSHTPTLHWP